MTHSQTLKKKTVKQNCHAGDADYIPDSGDDIQVGRSVVSKKQYPLKYIPPMSINRVANLRKLCRVFASNITQEVASTSNATKQTLSETFEGNQRKAKRMMVLIDEDDDEDDEIFEEGNRVDMEIDAFHHDYEYENMDDTVHTNNRFDAQMIDHDNLQQQIQHPDNEKATGAPKKVRSHTQKAEIWKMVSNERILVMFNKFGKPVGDEELFHQSVMIFVACGDKSGEDGILMLLKITRMFDMWGGFSIIGFDDIILPGFECSSLEYMLGRGAMKNDGIYPTRGEMCIKTLTCKDGSIVDDEAARVVTSLKAIESDSTSTLGDRDDFTKDNYSKVKGPQKRGYVRLVGRMPATKDNSDSPSDSQIIHQLQSAVNVMMNIIHEHIPNANLSTVLSDMNIHAKVLCLFVPGQSALFFSFMPKCRLPGYRPGCRGHLPDRRP
ncbi:hypothetical protein R6Q57_023619 [Mikania cordata]